MDFLRLIRSKDMKPLRLRVVGIADTDGLTTGVGRSGELDRYPSVGPEAVHRLDGLDLIIGLDGSESLVPALLDAKPPHVGFMDHHGALALIRAARAVTTRSAGGTPCVCEGSPDGPDTQTVLDSLPYRIMVVNRDKTVRSFNRTFLEDLGLEGCDVLGQPCYRVRYGLDRQCGETEGQCMLDAIVTTGEIISAVHEYHTPDGAQRFEVTTASPIFDDEGEIIQILEASRDITDRMSLEVQAQQSNVFLQNVIQSTVDGIVVVDTKGYVLIFNKGMERLTGYPSDEITGTGHLSTFYDMDVARENMRMMRSDRYGQPGILNPMSMTITARNGEEIPVTLSASLITIDDEEVGSVGVFTDMREIVKMRKDLEEAHLQLVQSEKIASVGRMAAGVAHEINNPLSGILIYAELLKESIAGNRQHLSDIQEIIDQTLRCKKIVSELLEFSRHTVGKVSSFSLDELLTKCLNLLVNQALFQNIRVTRDSEPDMPQMMGDMGQLQQVFTNLFINAADAMEGRGRLHIESRFDSGRKCFVIKVADTGPGIPAELQDQIFDIFFTTKPVGSGTGLGLSISQNIIKVHGGSISFECPREGGTTFIVEFPLEVTHTPVEEPVFIGLDEP